MLVFPMLSTLAIGRSSATSDGLEQVLTVTQLVSVSRFVGDVSVVVFFLALVWAIAFSALAINVGWRAVTATGQQRWQLYAWRAMVFVSSTFLFLPTLGALVDTMGCQGTEAVLGGCWQGAHLALSVLGAVFGCMFTALTIAAAAVYVDRTPGTTAWHAVSDGRADATMLLQQVVLIMVYGIVGAANLPGWLSVVILGFVATTWLHHFIMRQPHAVSFMNSLRAGCGAVFAWGVVCLAVALLRGSSDVGLLFFTGAVLSAALAHFMVLRRRMMLLQAQAVDVSSDVDLSLWARTRLQLAHDTTYSVLALPAAVWLGGGTLLAGWESRASSDGLTARQQVEALLRAVLPQQSEGARGAHEDEGYADHAVHDDSATTATALTPAHHGGLHAHFGEPGPVDVHQPEYEPAESVGGTQMTIRTDDVPSLSMPPSTSFAAAQQARRMMAGGAKASGRSSKRSRIAGGGSGAIDVSSARTAIATALTQQVHTELKSRDDDAKLSATLLMLLADMRAHCLKNKFMELMALSQAKSHASLPWDVQFWVEQRLQVLRTVQEHATGEGDLSPVDRLLFDQHFTWIMKHQRAWYRGLASMFRELASPTPDMAALQVSAQGLADALIDTEHNFRELMAINKNSVKVLRAKANYLIRIRRADAEGAALLSRAERLEAAALSRTQREVSHFKLLANGGEHLVMDDTAAVIVANGEMAHLGEITKVNAVAAALFRRTKNNMVGQNLSTLIPPPISDMHDMFLRRYANTGNTRLMNNTRNLLGLDSTGAIFPVRGTLRETPPLEGSSAAQFTMLMQPLRVAEHHLLFAGPAQGYQIWAGDAESYKLFGITYRSLGETAVSAVQFLPEVDMAFTAAWRAQRAAMEEDGADTDEAGAPMSLPMASRDAGGTGSRRRSLLQADKAFQRTPVTNVTSEHVKHVFAMVQKIMLPSAGGVLYLLSWKHTAEMHGRKRESATAHGGRGRSSSNISVRSRSARGGTDIDTRRHRSTSHVGASVAEVPMSPTMGHVARTMSEVGDGGRDESGQTATFPQPVPGADAAPTVLLADAVNTPSDATAEPTKLVPSALAPRTMGTRAKSVGANSPSSREQSAASPTGGIAKPTLLASFSSQESKGGKKLSRLPPSGQRSASLTRATRYLGSGPPTGGPTPTTPIARVPSRDPSLSKTDGSNINPFSEDDSDIDGSGYANSASTAATRHSLWTKHVLDITASEQQHPVVLHLRLSFLAQLILLLAFSVAIFVMRVDAVESLSVLVTAMKLGGERLLHARAAVMLATSMVLVNTGVHVDSIVSLRTKLTAELDTLSTITSDLQHSLGSMQNKLGFHVDDYTLPVTGAHGSLQYLTPYDATVWLLGHLSVVRDLPDAEVTTDHPSVGAVLNATSLLSDVFPRSVREVESATAQWIEHHNLEEAIVTVSGLVVAVVLVGSLSMLFISRLASHRVLVLRAMGSMPVRMVKALARASLQEGRRHLAMLANADEAEDDVGVVDDVEGGGRSGASAVMPSRQDSVEVPLGPPMASAGRKSDAAAAHTHRSVQSTESSTGGGVIDDSSHKSSQAPPGVLPGEAFSGGGALAGTGLRAVSRTGRNRGDLVDSSHFKAYALLRMMAPTVLIFAFLAGIWSDWFITTSALLKDAERTYAAQEAAVHSTAALQTILSSMLVLVRAGAVPGAVAAVDVSLAAALGGLQTLVQGTAAGSLTNSQLPAIQDGTWAAGVLTEDACAVQGGLYDMAGCAAFASGLLATSGVQGGMLRFTSQASELTSQVQSGAIAVGLNASQVDTLLASQRYAATVLANGTEALSRSRFLHRSVHPYMLGTCTALAEEFHDDTRGLHEAALGRSQALTAVLLCLMVVSMVAWIWPAARQLGKDVFATHALLAAVPPEVQVRVPSMKAALVKIAELTAQSGSDGTLTDMGAMLGFDEDEEDIAHGMSDEVLVATMPDAPEGASSSSSDGAPGAA